MRNKIIGSIIILILSLLSVYPLLITEQSDYSSLVFIAYYRLFLWVVWSFMILIFFISVFISKETRKKYWRLYLFNFCVVLIVVGGVSLKIQIDNNMRSHESNKKVIHEDQRIEELKENIIIDTYAINDCFYLSKDTLLENSYLIMSRLEFNNFLSKFSLKAGCQHFKMKELNFKNVSLLALPTITYGHEVDYERTMKFNIIDKKWYYHVNTIVTEEIPSMQSRILNFNLVLVPKLQLNDTVIFISNNNYIGLQIAK